MKNEKTDQIAISLSERLQSVWFGSHKYFVSAGRYTNCNFCGHFSASFDTLWRYHIIIQFVNIHPSHLYFESTGAKKIIAR